MFRAREMIKLIKLSLSLMSREKPVPKRQSKRVSLSLSLSEVVKLSLFWSQLACSNLEATPPQSPPPSPLQLHLCPVLHPLEDVERRRSYLLNAGQRSATG